MGYQVPKHHNKRGWKVLHVSYKNGKRIYRGVPAEEYAQLGLRVDMTREEAMKALAPKNAQAELARHETRRNKIEDRLKSERLVHESFLPADLLVEFESAKLDFTKPKLKSYWKRACEIMVEVRLEPKEWEDNAQKIYRAFTKRQMSPNYVRQVLPLLNAWGKFVAKKQGTYFVEIPKMRGRWHDDVAEAFYKKDSPRGNKKSAPLTPEQLKASEEKLKKEHYRWLTLSVWFGLRPIEVDQLSKPSSKRTWWLDTHDGVPVLWVYQTKLKGMAPEDRIKNIPAFLPEQQEALKLLGQPMKRPARKRMKNVFGGAITLYGGRNGFENLMRNHGQDFEVVSQWMGHTTTTRTYHSYFNKKTVRWKKAA